MNFSLIERFVPHAYETLTHAFPPGAVPERAYGHIVSNYTKLDDVDTYRIAYESNGNSVTGIMSLPQNIRPGFHPILIYNRGGNREYGKLTVYQAMGTFAALARLGYLVFASNYCGNDGGTGVEEFGGADVNDVLKLLDIARTHEGWNGQDAYLMGHSRGGMMTYLALKHGAKVNAAISIAGISDLFAAIAERPELEEKVYRQLIHAENREEAYRARSAVYWPEAITAPLLLLHGTADEAVTARHSERMAEALSTAGKPHELVVYPRGNHALVRDWKDVLKRVDDWCIRHRTPESRKQATCG